MAIRVSPNTAPIRSKPCILKACMYFELCVSCFTVGGFTLGVNMVLISWVHVWSDELSWVRHPCLSLLLQAPLCSSLFSILCSLFLRVPLDIVISPLCALILPEAWWSACGGTPLSIGRGSAKFGLGSACFEPMSVKLGSKLTNCGPMSANFGSIPMKLGPASLDLGLLRPILVRVRRRAWKDKWMMRGVFLPPRVVVWLRCASLFRRCFSFVCFSCFVCPIRFMNTLSRLARTHATSCLPECSELVV